MMNQIDFGDWVRKQRELRDLSQEDLANQAGVSLSTISLIERNKTKANPQTRQRINEVFRTVRVPYGDMPPAEEGNSLCP